MYRGITRCLHYGHVTHQPQGHGKNSGPIANMVMISDRPVEVSDRAVLSHFEGALIIGARGTSAVGTLIERTTRFPSLSHLPNGHSAKEVEAAMGKAIRTLESLIKTTTWDWASELARHVESSVATRVQVYFCDAHSPWQRGSSENTTGYCVITCQSTDLSKLSRADLKRIQDRMNDRPRKTSGF